MSELLQTKKLWIIHIFCLFISMISAGYANHLVTDLKSSLATHATSVQRLPENTIDHYGGEDMDHTHNISFTGEKVRL